MGQRGEETRMYIKPISLGESLTSRLGAVLCGEDHLAKEPAYESSG